MSSRCPHNMVNFGPLAAETGSGVWGTPTNFNGFRVFQRYCTVLQQWASAKLCSVEQRAPPIFGRTTITLGIGSHSIFQLSHTLITAALCNTAGHYILPCGFFFLSSIFFFSSPNLSRRKLDVYRTFTHGVALVRI